MRIGYIVLAAAMAAVGGTLVAIGDNHWWIPVVVALAMLLLGLDQKRHERHMDAIYSEHFGRPYERQRGWL